MRKILLLTIFFCIPAYATKEISFGDVVRKDSNSERYCAFVTNDNLCLMYQDEAQAFCLSQKTDLPSAREFAVYAMSLGAKGILEVDYVASALYGQPPPGYTEIQVVNSSGSGDRFYYSPEGYRWPAGHFGSNNFWSSSTNIYTKQIATLFMGETGQIGSGLHNAAQSAVRCVQQ